MKRTALALGLVLAALALVACGGSGGGTTSGGGETGSATESEGGGATGGGEGGGSVVEIAADPGGSLAYTATEASAEAGEVTVEFTNEAPIEHDVNIEDASGEVLLETEIITESSESATAELPAGEYTFYCSVPGHREAGMEGTLVVE